MAFHFLSPVAVAGFLVCLLVVIPDGLTVRIQFFENTNYTKFLKEVDVVGEKQSECHNGFIWEENPHIDIPKMMVLGSVKTEKCIMLYSNAFCWTAEPQSDSWRLDKDAPTFQDSEQAKQSKFWSFHVCSNEKAGGAILDVDIYSEPSYGGSISTKYRNICGCKNVPASIVGTEAKPISINNYGNSIEIFTGEHCQGRSAIVQPGNTYFSRKLYVPIALPDRWVETYDIRSLKPAGPLNCLKMDAVIFKFVFTNGTGFKDVQTENVQLAANTILRSNGAAKLTQEYTVSSKVTESLEYTVATGYSNMHSVAVHFGYEASVKGGVPFVAEGKSKWSFDLNYNYQRTDSGSTTNKTTTSKEEAISIRQNIEIPPCTECTVSSFVKKVKNFPIAYEAYAKVKGTAANVTMSAADIKGYLQPGHDYVRDVDDTTVETVAKGVMYAEYGLNTFINADCLPIPGCRVTQPGGGGGGAPEAEHFVIEQPLAFIE